MAKTLSNTWRIVRQDSNGFQVVEHENLCETAAMLRVQKREAQIGFHHQTVWRQRMSEPRPGPLILSPAR